MRLLIVGEPAPGDGLAGALEAGGIVLERPPNGTASVSIEDEVGQIAAALVAFEGLLSTDAPDAVLLASASNLAVAALLVATKLLIPVVGVQSEAPIGNGLGELNARLIEQLADATLAEDAGTIIAWLHESLPA